MSEPAPRSAAAVAVDDRRTDPAPDSAAIAGRPAHFLLSLPARALLALIWLYQRTLSPALPVLLGPSCGCRFYPSCSHYAAGAIRRHGAVAGAWLALCRLVKCTPLHPGGPDPVPATFPFPGLRPAPRCVRVAPSLPSSLTPFQS